MSTRANIICYACEQDGSAIKLATLYRHMDGYPEGLGLDLLTGLKDCDGDRRLLADLGKMDYPPEFTTGIHADIEYLYKIYAGQMSHRQDKKAIQITYMPVSCWDMDDTGYTKLAKPGHKGEKNILTNPEVLIELRESKDPAMLAWLPKDEADTAESVLADKDVADEIG